MFQEIVLLTVSIIIYTLIYHYKREISQKYKLIDLPNEKRKIHISPTPIIGGLIIMVVFFLNVFVYFFLNLTNDIIIILSLSLIFFLVGLIDDIKNLSSYFRLIFLFFRIEFFRPLDY